MVDIKKVCTHFYLIIISKFHKLLSFYNSISRICDYKRYRKCSKSFSTKVTFGIVYYIYILRNKFIAKPNRLELDQIVVLIHLIVI